MLSTARSGRAVRFPAIIRNGENCGSLASLMNALLQRLYHLYFAGVKSAKEKICGALCSKSAAEVKEKYFGSVKFSTQMLKTLCKTPSARTLTRHSSTN